MWYAFAEDTVEEHIAATIVARMANMSGMAGDDTAMLEVITQEIEAAATERVVS